MRSATSLAVAAFGAALLVPPAALAQPALDPGLAGWSHRISGRPDLL